MQAYYEIKRTRKIKINNYVYSYNVPTGKRPLGRPRRRWEDNIMDLESG